VRQRTLRGPSSNAAASSKREEHRSRAANCKVLTKLKQRRQRTKLTRMDAKRRRSSNGYVDGLTLSRSRINHLLVNAGLARY
jgi:hypothetical protein